MKDFNCTRAKRAFCYGEQLCYAERLIFKTHKYQISKIKRKFKLIIQYAVCCCFLFLSLSFFFHNASHILLWSLFFNYLGGIINCVYSLRGAAYAHVSVQAGVRPTDRDPSFK